MKVVGVPLAVKAFVSIMVLLSGISRLSALKLTLSGYGPCHQT